MMNTRIWIISLLGWLNVHASYKLDPTVRPFYNVNTSLFTPRITQDEQQKRSHRGPSFCPTQKTVEAPKSILSFLGLAPIVEPKFLPLDVELLKASAAKLQQLDELARNASSDYIQPPPAAAFINPRASEQEIRYHGGALMPSEVRVYFIWYGDWDRNSDYVDIISSFVNNVDQSELIKSLSAYAMNGQQLPGQKIRVGGSTFDRGSRGLNINTNLIWQIVRTKIKTGLLPEDPDGIYMLLGAKNVKERNFCSAHCGWHHSSFFLDPEAFASPIRISFIGDPSGCPQLDNCIPKLNLRSSPNGNPAADAMVSIVFHEITETVTDPEISHGWAKVSSEATIEIADECAWTYGNSLFVDQNRANLNMIVGGRAYLVQQIHIRDPATGDMVCGMK